VAQDVTENQNQSTLLLLLELDVTLDGTLVVILQHTSCGWRGKTSGSCSLVPRSQAKFVQSLGAHKELDVPISFGLGMRLWQLWGVTVKMGSA